MEWKRFKSGNQTVDARVIHPHSESGDLILFCPGFPGGGATIYEQAHADQVVVHNYTQIVLRHNGTILDGPKSDFMLNNIQYPKATTHHHDGWIGGKPSSIAGWLIEPQTVLEEVGFSYSNIYVLAHSFGAVALLNSLANLHENGSHILDKVQAVALLAPALGVLEGKEEENIMRIWHEDFLTSSAVLEKVALEDDPPSIQMAMKNIYRFLPQRVASLPGHIRFNLLHVARDEYIREEDVRGFAAACKRGDVVIDTIDHPHKAHGGIDAHDMPDYPTEMLLQLIERPSILTDILPFPNN